MLMISSLICKERGGNTLSSAHLGRWLWASSVVRGVSTRSTYLGLWFLLFIFLYQYPERQVFVAPFYSDKIGEDWGNCKWAIVELQVGYSRTNLIADG